MENATKALMIAGAVLIAIMIIGVGMMIFNSGNDAMQGALGQMGQFEKDQWNNDYLQYEGAQKGTKVKALISSVITSNATVKEAGEEDAKTITFVYEDKEYTEANNLSTVRSQIVAGKTYTISFEYTSGLILKIKCEVVK